MLLKLLHHLSLSCFEHFCKRHRLCWLLFLGDKHFN
jgi:hypothetical protein